MTDREASIEYGRFLERKPAFWAGFQLGMVAGIAIAVLMYALVVL